MTISQHDFIVFHNHPAIIYKKIVHQHNLLGFGLEDTLIKRL